MMSGPCSSIASITESYVVASATTAIPGFRSKIDLMPTRVITLRSATTIRVVAVGERRPGETSGRTLGAIFDVTCLPSQMSRNLPIQSARLGLGNNTRPIAGSLAHLISMLRDGKTVGMRGKK
jgi:hypothetical protein